MVVDSAVTNISQLASHPLIVKPGMEALLIDGLLKAIIDLDLVDEEATKQHPQAFTALKQAIQKLSLDQIATQTGISTEQIHDVATIFAEAPRSIALCAEGIVRRPNGYRNVLKLIDLAWITGKLGRPGCGVNTVTEENNEQGAIDMGAAAEFLPGQARFDDPTARQRFEQAWDVTLPAGQSGATLLEILERCRQGHIKALYVIGENPLGTLPASVGVKAALENLPLLIVQDPFLTDTARLAHFVLPASTYAEKDGTFTNLEGKVLRVRQALDPVGESFPDWHIMTAMANGLGYQWSYESSQDIQNEIMKLLPGYYNLGHPRKLTPDPTAYLSNGYVAEVAERYGAGTTSLPDQDGRTFSLAIGQTLYHSGKLSTQASGLLRIQPSSGRLWMNPKDMERLGLREDSVVRVSSATGSIEIKPKPDNDVMPGSCFFPEHFSDPPVKDLIAVEADPITDVPYFKSGRVRIEKAGS
jgi:formate dehydrogenase alpha subunit